LNIHFMLKLTERSGKRQQTQALSPDGRKHLQESQN